MAALLAKTRQAALTGQFELFKTSHALRRDGKKPAVDGLTANPFRNG